MKAGILYIVPTPIGNLQDITLRALAVLKSVDLIAAEDTRNTGRLLDYFKIKVPLKSYHDHVEDRKAGQLISEVKAGKKIALVSDGGMPLISDPGFVLMQLAIKEKVQVEILPGPSAFVNALVASGLPVDRFAFEGFLSRSPSKRRKRLREIEGEKRTIIFYESPHRLMKTLIDMQAIFGEREISVSREITKKFEEHYRGKIGQAVEYFRKQGVRGEFVIVVHGNNCEEEVYVKEDKRKKY